jgi:hypothetical protein
MRSLTAASVLLLALLGACDSGNSSKSDSSATHPATSSAPSEPETTADASDPTGKATGTPKTDPCDLLTKGIAEGALGVPVGPATRTPGEGNVTCSYKPADGASNVLVLLTTYAGSGEAALATATKAFPDAKPVPNLGDMALVSRQGHAIGVSIDDLLFGMSLVRADAFDVSPAVVEAQLITLAHTVVDAR